MIWSSLVFVSITITTSYIEGYQSSLCPSFRSRIYVPPRRSEKLSRSSVWRSSMEKRQTDEGVAGKRLHGHVHVHIPRHTCRSEWVDARPPYLRPPHDFYISADKAVSGLAYIHIHAYGYELTHRSRSRRVKSELSRRMAILASQTVNTFLNKSFLPRPPRALRMPPPPLALPLGFRPRIGNYPLVCALSFGSRVG